MRIEINIIPPVDFFYFLFTYHSDLIFTFTVYFTFFYQSNQKVSLLQTNYDIMYIILKNLLQILRTQVHYPATILV